MELCLIPCGSLDGRGVWRSMDTCTCMAESLRYSPDTITTLLTGYTTIQNKKFKKRSVGFQNLPPYLRIDGGMICSTHQHHGNSDSFPVGSSGGVKILLLLLGLGLEVTPKFWGEGSDAEKRVNREPCVLWTDALVFHC